MLNTIAGVGTDFLSQALDPINAASAFIPVVGEARYASWLADAGGVVGRTALRAGVGAAQGAVGQAAIEPLRLGLAAGEQSDYTATDSLLNIAYGGLLGGGLHSVAGAIADVLHGPFKSSPGRTASGADAIQAAPLSVREAALRSSIAALAEGRPVEVEPLFTGNELGGRTRTLADLENENQSMLGEPATDPGLQSDLEILRGNAAQPAPAQSFMSAIRALGPVKDEQGELELLRDHQSQPAGARVENRPQSR